MSPLRAQGPPTSGTAQSSSARIAHTSFKRAPRRDNVVVMRAERRGEQAKSVVSDDTHHTHTKGARSTVAESIGVSMGGVVAADGVSAYLSMCAQLDEEPIPTIVHQLHGTFLNLNHYEFSEQQMEAVSAGLEKNTCVTVMSIVDASLTSECMCLLFEGLRRNTAIRKLDVSENDTLDKKSATALSQYLAKNTVLHHLTLRGLGLTDAYFDFLVRNGIEKNSKSLAHLDLAYNMLSEDSLANIEQLIYAKGHLIHLDLSWNLLTAAGIKQLERAVHERSKPRSSKRDDGSARVKKPMVKMTLVATGSEQRRSLMHLTGVSGVTRWLPEPSVLISQADYVTLCVAQRSPKLVPLFKFRLMRLLTSGRLLTSQMVAQQLADNFKGEDEALQKMALETLLHKLESPEQLYLLKDVVDAEFVAHVDQQIQQLSGSPTGLDSQHNSFL